jgi:hypothetical protein
MKYSYLIIAALVFTLMVSCESNSEVINEEEMQIENPVATTLLFPLDNTECHDGNIINNTQSTVVFKWNASEHTDSYQIHLENLDNVTQSTHESNTNELEIVLERGAAYRWSVVSKSNVTHETAQSEKWNFYNAGAGGVNHAPNNTTVTIGSGSVMLNWEASDIDNDIVLYEVFMDTNSQPTTSGGTTYGTEITLDMTIDTTYYWFIETTDKTYNTSRSEVFRFSTE